MSDATRTAGAKRLPSQACFIVPIAVRVQIRDEEFYKSISDKGLPIGKISEYKSEYDEMNPVESKKDSITYKALINRLETDLNRLDRALEIYLSEYVGKIECELISPDIKK